MLYYEILFNLCTSFTNLTKYRGIHEEGSGDVVSAVCYTIYTIYLTLCAQTAETTSPEPFREFPCILSILNSDISLQK